MDNMGAWPLRIFLHALSISRGEMLGLGLAAFILEFDAALRKDDVQLAMFFRIDNHRIFADRKMKLLTGSIYSSGMKLAKGSEGKIALVYLGLGGGSEAAGASLTPFGLPIVATLSTLNFL
jgi:hypothetical protein